MKLLLISVLLFSAPSFAASVCASAFQSTEFRGAMLQIEDGQNIENLETLDLTSASGERIGSWNNRVSSLVVQPGCTLIGYQMENFGVHSTTGDRFGWATAWTASVNGPATTVSDLGVADNRLSSVRCLCAK